MQQPTTVKVIFVTKVKGFDAFVTSTPPFINFSARPPRNIEVNDYVSKPNILASRNFN